MALLVNLCLPCVLVYCSRGLGEVNGIYLQVIRASFLRSGEGKRIYQSVNRPILNKFVLFFLQTKSRIGFFDTIYLLSH